jgi:hypothetical protein
VVLVVYKGDQRLLLRPEHTQVPQPHGVVHAVDLLVVVCARVACDCDAEPEPEPEHTLGAHCSTR